MSSEPTIATPASSFSLAPLFGLETWPHAARSSSARAPPPGSDITSRAAITARAIFIFTWAPPHLPSLVRLERHTETGGRSSLPFPYVWVFGLRDAASGLALRSSTNCTNDWARRRVHEVEKSSDLLLDVRVRIGCCQGP